MSKQTQFAQLDERGMLPASSRLLLDKALEGFAGKPVVITIERRARKRSSRQNRFYWGVVVPLVYERLREQGYTDIHTHEDAHEVLKGMFNPSVFTDQRSGLSVRYGRSTASMGPSAFMDYIAAIQQWAAESLGILIPDPINLIQ